MPSPVFRPHAKVASKRHPGGRFPVRLEVRYCESGRKRIGGKRGNGVTRSIGSRCVTFTTEHVLRAGLQVELAVDWPVRLNETTPLSLVIYGRVMRSVGQYAAVRIERHEFRASPYPEVGLK